MTDRLAALERVASETVAEAKGGCGRFNQHKDCTPYTSRSMTCPDCPYELVADLDAALSSPAPAPCSTEQPICPVLGGECPRFSAQPAPSDVVMVPTNRISTLLAFIEEIRVRSTRNRNVIDVVVDVKDYNYLRALAAALRQGGG